MGWQMVQWVNLIRIEQNEDGGSYSRLVGFPESSKTGEKIRRKAAGYMMANNISRSAVPIARRTSTITLNNNKTIVAKRNHFPLVSACAMTIHKSQGGTFNEIVYEYHKNHSQQLLYVALSRVTSIEGLYITTRDNDPTFYHGRRTTTSMVSLQEEFRRLSLNRLMTIDRLLLDFISARRGMSICSLNCQSLGAHKADLTDVVVQRANILIFPKLG